MVISKKLRALSKYSKSKEFDISSANQIALKIVEEIKVKQQQMKSIFEAFEKSLILSQNYLKSKDLLEIASMGNNGKVFHMQDKNVCEVSEETYIKAFETLIGRIKEEQKK